MPILFDTSPLLSPPFQSREFTPTLWQTAESKAQFANALCRFIAAGFKESLFTETLYRRLALSFGHIGWCDRGGFFDHYFRSLHGQLAFLEESLRWNPCGEPAWTWCDVERAVQDRLRSANLLAAERALFDAEKERFERQLLRRLQEKYEARNMISRTSVQHPGAATLQAEKPPPAAQAHLF
ncbi:MAG: hypothetical protein ACREFP_14510 [Acetobacteraceae bacterium]